MIRNIEKRKELQQMVYDRYTPNLTEDEKKELENEVGAAFYAYHMALEDIVQIIVDGNNDGETLTATKNFIKEQFNGKAGSNLFHFSECPTTQMKEYIRTTVKEELMRKGESETDALLICNAFINFPSVRESIIEKKEIDSIRICEHCGKPMHEGYLKDDYDTYCSEECVKEHYHMTDEELEEMVSHADENDAPLFWTTWEG